MANREDDFREPEKMELARRAGMHCSNPACEKLTVGPGKRGEDKSVLVGRAAHIQAASIGGPRYDPKMSSGERSSAELNGLWLCVNCADMIDKNNGSGYSVALLHSWRRHRELTARELIEGYSGVGAPGSSVSPFEGEIPPGFQHSASAWGPDSSGAPVVIRSEFVPTHLPNLSIETGNGWPWDIDRYAPAETGDAYRSGAERQDAFTEYMNELAIRTAEDGWPDPDLLSSPPPDLTAPPVEGFSKRLRVSNAGPGVATNCRVRCSSTAPIMDLVWEGKTGNQLDIAAGDEEYVLFDFSGFQAEGRFELTLKLFVDHISTPAMSILTVDILRGMFPAVVQ